MSTRSRIEESVGLTGIELVRVGRDLDVDKVDLELLVRLDSDQQRRPSSGENNLAREVDRLESESERSLLQKGDDPKEEEMVSELGAGAELTLPPRASWRADELVQEPKSQI